MGSVTGQLDAVYVAYWSLCDPLCLSQSLPVVRALATQGWRLALVTYEQPQWALGVDARARMSAELARDGLMWVPLRYHKRPAVLSTLYDIAVGIRCGLALARQRGVRLVHARASVSGAIGYAVSRLTSARFFYDSDGPLSEEYVDAGIWRRGSLAHRMTAWMENRCASVADTVAVLSGERQREIASHHDRTPLVIPCAVDTTHFQRLPDVGHRLRRDLGLTGTVFVYAGKSGGWYRTDAMLDFVAAAGEILGPVSLLVLTTEPAERFTTAAANKRVSAVVRRATRDEMPGFLSAADIGLTFLLDARSKRASSPIKNGEYLACGLPVVSTPGAGDYDDLLMRRRVGVIVNESSAGGYRRAAEELRTLTADAALRDRCRRAAIEEVGLQEVVVPRYLDTYERLLGAPTAHPATSWMASGRP